MYTPECHEITKEYEAGYEAGELKAKEDIEEIKQEAYDQGYGDGAAEEINNTRVVIQDLSRLASELISYHSNNQELLESFISKVSNCAELDQFPTKITDLY